jgi:hypothetical protein
MSIHEAGWSLPRYSTGGAGGAGGGGVTGVGHAGAAGQMRGSIARACGAGALAQPASIATQAAQAIADNVAWQRPCEVENVVWVFLEIAAALGVAIAIVWWTFPREAKKDAAPERDDVEGR